MDATEYKHVVLGLIFLKYISDAFEAKHAELEAQKAQGADPEDPHEYRRPARPNLLKNSIPATIERFWRLIRAKADVQSLLRSIPRPRSAPPQVS